MTGKPQMRPPIQLVMEIASEEAARLDLPVELIFTTDRRIRVSWARWRTIKRLRSYGRYSMPAIAEVMCLRNHTSVLHALRQDTDGEPIALRDRKRKRFLAIPDHRQQPEAWVRLPPSQIEVSRAQMMGGR